MQRSALCRSRREHSNEYLLAKFGFDTAVNEPFQVCPLSAYRSPRFDNPRAVHKMAVEAEGNWLPKVAPKKVLQKCFIPETLVLNAKRYPYFWGTWPETLSETPAETAKRYTSPDA